MSLAATAPRAALSQELNTFLVDFSVALHKHTMYPSAHPSLGPAAVRVTQRAVRLLRDRPMLAFGVARHQLIIDGVATDPNQPVLRRLAEALHMHRLGAVSILPGVDSSEISSAIRTLAVEVGNGVRPLGDDRSGRLNEWQHIRLHPLTLERLELVDDEPGASTSSDEQLDHHAARLWVGLANAALAVDAHTPQERLVTDPVTVARAIDHNAGAEAYDQVIVGYLLQIADELKASAGSEDAALRRRTARLIDALDPGTLQRLLAMGGDGSQRRAFVRSAASGMAVDSVVKILRAAAAASQQTISHGLLRMLSKLASHAEAGEVHARPMADVELREQVDRLLAGWTLEDPSPEAYSKTLQHLAISGGVKNADDESASPHEADPVRVVQISLEVAGAGPMVERAIDQAIDDGAIKELRALVSTPPEESQSTADVIRERLSGARAMSAILLQPSIDFDLLDALLPSISVDAYEVLLGALMASENRATRRKLIDRLGRTKLDVAPVIAEKLEDERWYVQRNLLLLLERLRRVPQGFSASHWTQHPDARVRYQGVSLQLAVPAERESAIRVALADCEPRIIRLGLVAAQTSCPETLIPLLAELSRNARLADELRLLAVTALGKSRHESALDALLELVNGGKTFLGRPKLASPTPIVLSALRAIAQAWSAHDAAQHFLTQARRSFTSEFRQAVRG